MERDYGTPRHQQHGGTPAARSASRTNRRGGSNQLGVLREGTRMRSPAPRIPGLVPDASSATAAQRTMNRRSTQSPQSLPTTNTSVSQPGQSHGRRQQQQQLKSNSTEPSWRQRPSMAATALSSDGAAAFATTQGRPSRRASSPSGNSPDEDRRRCQRDKQISFGYATDGYVNMERLIRHDPLLKSGGLLPLSPPTIGKGSKRMWDIQVRKWRRALHMFDFVFIDGEDDPATQATVLEEQRQQWVSEAFHGAPREMRQTISLAALRRVQGSPAVPTKIPVERDLRCILRSEDCYEAVSSVVPQSASSLTKGTDISPLEAGIKIHIAPSSAVLQRQLAQKELQQHLASLHQQQQQSMSSSAEQTEALPAASVSTPPRQHRNSPLAGSTPQPASVQTGREEMPRSPSPRPPQQSVAEMVRCEGERHPSLAAHQHEQHAHQGVGHHTSATTAAEVTSGSNATTASVARMAAPPASSSSTTRRSDMASASASHHAPPQSTQPSPSRFFHEPIPLTDVVAPPRPPAGAVLAPPPPFPGAAAMPWCEPHATAADGMRFMYAMPSNFAAAAAAGGGGGVQMVAQSCAAPGAPWVPPQLPVFANPSVLQMPLSVMLPPPPGHMMAASLSTSFPYYEAGFSGRVVGTLPQPMMVQQQHQQQQGSVLYGVYPSSMERTSAEAHTPAAAPARDGDRRRNSSNSAAATGTPQTIPRFVARLSTSPSERRLGEQHQQQQQQQRSSMQKGNGGEGKEDAEDSPCVPHTRPSPPTPPSHSDTQRSAERVSPKSPSVVPPLPQPQPHAQPHPSLSAWTPERVLFGSGAATASTEARTVRAGDSLEGSNRDASLKQRAESSNEDVVAAHLNFQMEAA